MFVNKFLNQPPKMYIRKFQLNLQQYIMNKKVRLLTILVVICAYASAQDCLKTFRATPNSNIEFVETGHFSIQATDFSSRENKARVTFKDNYKGSIPSVGLSIIYIKGYSDSTGVDFLIRPSISQTYFDALFTISVKALWINTHIHYIATSRTEFVTGIVDLTHKNLIDPVPNSVTFDVSVPVVAKFPVYTAYAEITGLKSEQNTFNLLIKQDLVRLGNNTLIVGLSVSNKMKAIELLSVTYFATLKNTNFTIQPLPQTDIFNLGNNFKDFAQQKFPNITTSNTPPEVNDYIIAGAVAYNGQNLGKIKIDPIRNLRDAMRTFREKQKKPSRRMLAVNSGFDNRPLVNPRNYTFPDDVIFTKSQSMTDDQKRVFYLAMIADAPPFVPPGFDIYAGVDAAWLETWKNVFEIRGFGKMANTAYLPPLFFRSNDNEIPPTLAQTINRTVCVDYDTCIGNNGKIQTQKDGNPGCSFCPADKQFSIETNACECKEGFFKSGEKCIQINKFCNSNDIFLNGTCFTLTKTKEMCDPAQRQEYSLKQNRCKCQQNFEQTIGKEGVMVCVPTCPAEATRSLITNQCICPGNSYFENGKCIRCKRLSVWNPSKNQCECLPNSRTGPNGECQPCSSFATYDASTNTCKCQPGYSGGGIFCRPR